MLWLYDEWLKLQMGLLRIYGVDLFVFVFFFLKKWSGPLLMEICITNKDILGKFTWGL